MTREEAENILVVMKMSIEMDATPIITHKELREALDLAIQALEQEPTKEEKAILQKWRDNRGISMKDFEDAMDALEQEPCEDCISRRDALVIIECAYEECKIGYTDYIEMRDAVKDTLSVKPQRTKGHWIMKHRSYNEMKYLTGTDEMGVEHTVKKYESYEIDELYCSKCGKRAGDTSLNFCPNCGASMEVEE